MFSQVNFSEDISSIIYNNCTECHRDGGAGPMPFTSYEEVAALGFMVEYVTASGYMPPWHADPDYSNFIGERVLTESEKQLISDWVANGMPQGDPTLEASIPEFPEGSVVGVPDAVFTMQEEYLIEGNNQDDYRVFVFSTNFTEDKYLKSIEIMPGNLSAVHHVLVNIDTLGACAALDASTPEYGYECESGFCVGNIPQLSAGYTPGMVPPLWNDDIGLVLPAGADIAIQMHYAPSSIDQYDQSSVNLFFKDQPVEREVEVLTIVDTQLEIPANEVYTHYNSFEIPFDISIISVLPHMHLIGKSWLIYAENDGDTIPIISIPDWDFNWQTFYQPQYMLKLPEGYTLHAYATYDNTSSNPTNPNSPPQDMFWCDYTTCEMFFLPFSYVPHQEGDENIYLGDENDLGCTDTLSCNYDESAIIDNGLCGVLDDCGVCHIPCCYNLNTQICDYSVSQENCTEYWPTLEEIASDQNPYWNTDCIFGCTIPGMFNYNPEATVNDGSCIPYVFGCTDVEACNYFEEANTGDENCTYPGSTCPLIVHSNCCCCGGPCDCICEDDPQVGEVLSMGAVCFNTNGDFAILDGGVFDENCNCAGLLGCTDSLACNYNENATANDLSCEYPEQYYDCNGDCIIDSDSDGVCDELECDSVFCSEFYECVLGDCICINDQDSDGVCDENEEDCLNLEILSINQINPDQFSVTIENNSVNNIFSYPGFILFNEFGDTIAIENVQYYGIAAQSVHVLDIQESVEITTILNLELHTWFYDYLTCQWTDLMISENCELQPQSGECEAAFEIYYYNQNTNQCEMTLWGGCFGVVPFWSLEDCQDACQTVLIPELESDREIVKITDVLGRNIFSNEGVVIKLYNDGSVEKELILIK